MCLACLAFLEYLDHLEINTDITAFEVIKVSKAINVADGLPPLLLQARYQANGL